jgi:hypothetical protein
MRNTPASSPITDKSTRSKSPDLSGVDIGSRAIQSGVVNDSITSENFNLTHILQRSPTGNPLTREQTPARLREFVEPGGDFFRRSAVCRHQFRHKRWMIRAAGPSIISGAVVLMSHRGE